MGIAVVFSLGLGLAAVLQAALNRRIAGEVGFINATLLNNVVLFGFSLAVILALATQGHWLEHLRSREVSWHWWYLVPGLCGFYIVMMLPMVIAKAGASKAFVLFIAAQLIFSAGWDYLIEGIEVSPQQIIGVMIVFIGSFLAVMS